LIDELGCKGSTVWVLIRRLNSSCNRSIAFVVPRAAPLAGWQLGDGEELLASVMQTLRRVGEQNDASLHR